MIECHSLKNFEKVLVLAVAVAFHTHEDSVIDQPGIPTPKDARKILENLMFEGGVVDDSESYSHLKKSDTVTAHKYRKRKASEIEDAENIANDQVSSIDKWVDGVRARGQQMITQGQNLNPFYLPGFIEPLIKLAKEFPLWTAVGMPINTERASSSIVEEYFKDLKNHTLKHYTLPISANKFMREHIKDNEGANCIFSGKIVEYTNNRLHPKQIKSVNEVAPVKEIEVMNTEIHDIFQIMNVSHNVEIFSENQEQKNVDDSDFLAFENWGGRGNAMCFDKRRHNADDIQDISDEEGKDLYIHTEFDHSYEKYASLKSNDEKMIYSVFESSLDKEADFSSPVIENSTQQKAKRSKFFGPYPEIKQQNFRAAEKKILLWRKLHYCQMDRFRTL